MKPADQLKVIMLSFFSLAVLIAIITTVSIMTNKMMGAHGSEHGATAEHGAAKTEEHAAAKTEEHAAAKTEEHAAAKTEEHAAAKTEEHAAAKTEEHAAAKTEEHAAAKTEEQATTKVVAATGDAKAGAEVFKAKTCTTCHVVSSVPGANGAIGPKLDGLGKTAATRVPGKDAIAYIKESIENPTAFVVSGYPPAMPSLRTTMNDKEFENLVAFLASL